METGLLLEMPSFISNRGEAQLISAPMENAFKLLGKTIRHTSLLSARMLGRGSSQLPG